MVASQLHIASTVCIIGGRYIIVQSCSLFKLLIPVQPDYHLITAKHDVLCDFSIQSSITRHTLHISDRDYKLPSSIPHSSASSSSFPLLEHTIDIWSISLEPTFNHIMAPTSRLALPPMTPSDIPSTMPLPVKRNSSVSSDSSDTSISMPSIVVSDGTSGK